MLPEEDRQALKKNGYKISPKGVISPIANPLQTHNRKSSSSAAQLGRQQERDSLNNSRATEPKATPIASNTRLHGSADAEERRRAGSSLKPKRTPTFNPTASNTWLHASADAEERRRAGSSLKPKPIPGSATDLPEARKALQQTRDASQNLKKLNKGGVWSAELRDLQRETSIAEARVDASEAAKKLQDFPTARRSKSQNRGITEEIRSDLAQRAYSAKERYMNSQGLDSSGQSIKLTPPKQPKPPAEQQKGFSPQKFQQDFAIGVVKGGWDAIKGVGGLAKGVYDLSLNPNPEVREQTAQSVGEGLRSFVENPAIQSLTHPVLAVRNFTSRPRETTQAFKDLGTGIVQPYVDAWKSGRPGEALGRVTFDVGSMFVPGGAIIKASRANTVISTVGTAANVADEAGDIAVLSWVQYSNNSE